MIRTSACPVARSAFEIRILGLRALSCVSEVLHRKAVVIFGVHARERYLRARRR